VVTTSETYSCSFETQIFRRGQLSHADDGKAFGYCFVIWWCLLCTRSTSWIFL